MKEAVFISLCKEAAPKLRGGSYADEPALQRPHRLDGFGNYFNVYLKIF